MKQFPKSLKFKKNHKLNSLNLRLKGQAECFPRYGMYGVQILKNTRLTFKQVEACRRSLRRKVKGSGRV
jgi:ribosomal protein L16/L10AE